MSNQNQDLTFRFKLPLLISLGALSVLTLLLILIYLGAIHTDTTYLRQTAQLNEEPIDPFYVVEVIYNHTDHGVTSITRQDTLHLIVDSEDIYDVEVLLYGGHNCGLGWCVEDSVVTFKTELIE